MKKSIAQMLAWITTLGLVVVTRILFSSYFGHEPNQFWPHSDTTGVHVEPGGKSQRASFDEFALNPERTSGSRIEMPPLKTHLAAQNIGESLWLANTAISILKNDQNVPSNNSASLGGKSQILAVNALGQTVGYSYLKNSKELHAFLSDSGQVIDLGTLGGSNSVANDVNNIGQVVGQATNVYDEPRAFLWTRESGMTQLKSPYGSTTCAALKINDAGQIVGFYADESGRTRACLWHEGNVFDLGTLGGKISVATAIDKSGLIVGYSETSTGQTHAFVWQNGQIRDMNDLIPSQAGWELVQACGITSERGICGQGRLNGEESTFMLTTALFTNAL